LQPLSERRNEPACSIRNGLLFDVFCSAVPATAGPEMALSAVRSDTHGDCVVPVRPAFQSHSANAFDRVLKNLRAKVL
jgi:hypothetical protein